MRSCEQPPGNQTERGATKTGKGFKNTHKRYAVSLSDMFNYRRYDELIHINMNYEI